MSISNALFEFPDFLNIPKNEIATSEQRYAILRFPHRGKHPSATLLLLFRKKPRSARLLSCKRARDVSLSLPPFCELRLRRYKKVESGKRKAANGKDTVTSHQTS